MSVVFDTIHDDARQRICAIAADLSPEQPDSTVPIAGHPPAQRLGARPSAP
ncbi:MAG: hypothetical protein ACRDRK_19885 [Pseudonocardia sp.]